MFGSDNQSGAAPAIMDAIFAANHGRVPSYGADSYTKRAEELIKQIFETDNLDFYIVTTGGAANGLALSAICPSWGAIICQTHAHIIADEGNGPELFSGGARLIGLDGVGGKLVPQTLEDAAANYSKDFVHGPQIKAVSLTNLNENGEIYSAGEAAALCDIAKAHNWRVHMDGARFANAIVATNQSAADLSWRAGIDALSFGLTKNGALMAESIILFGDARNEAAPYLQKRAGQLISKQRFLGAQFVAMLENGLWLELARHANKAGRGLADVFANAGYSLATKPDANEVFVNLPNQIAQKLSEAGILFYPWPALGKDCYRFVCNWQTDDDDIRALANLL